MKTDGKERLYIAAIDGDKKDTDLTIVGFTGRHNVKISLKVPGLHHVLEVPAIPGKRKAYGGYHYHDPKSKEIVLLGNDPSKLGEFLTAHTNYYCVMEV